MPKQPASAKHVASNVSSYCAQAAGDWPSLTIGIGMTDLNLLFTCQGLSQSSGSGTAPSHAPAREQTLFR